MARIVALIPDLLFGSNVVGTLTAAGHEVELAMEVPGAAAGDLLIIDLTAEAPDRIEAARSLLGDIPSLAFYSHVEVEVRELALRAGIDLVVPRSRMAREAPALVERLLGAGA